MFRKNFTNKEWNSLNWVSTGFKIGEDGINTCKEVAEKLGYEGTDMKDDYTHSIYKKDGQLYFIANRSGSIEIAEADFVGDYKGIKYQNKKNGIIYSQDAFESLIKKSEHKAIDFEVIK